MCERASVDGRTHAICKTQFSLDGATFVFRYKSPVTGLIKGLKFKFGREIASILVEWANEELKNQYFLSEDFTLVPIPLHTLRNNWRGFNQSELLGKEIASRMGWKYNSGILIRSKLRPPQTKVREAQKRRQNVRGVFSILPNAPIIQCPNILLFDDVWTTGATMREAARVLKHAGAKFVWGLAIAR